MSPGDVALLDTLGGWTVHVPGHPDEVAPLLRAAAGHDDPVYLRLSTQPQRPAYATGRAPAARSLRRRRAGRAGGGRGRADARPGAARRSAGLDVTVAYTHTPRPFDAAGLRALRPARDVILVEPYLAGTSSAVVAEALRGRTRTGCWRLGVGRTDLRRYGSPADHARWHGLDAAGLRASISGFLS